MTKLEFAKQMESYFYFLDENMNEEEILDYAYYIFYEYFNNNTKSPKIRDKIRKSL